MAHPLLPHVNPTLTSDFLIDLLTALWLGFIGACIGSFLNVVAYRLPRGLSVVWKSSHCPHCGHAIRFRDNVPVLGWLRLRGRCRDCGGPIAARYAIVEGIHGAVFFLLAYAELFSAGANLPAGPFSQFTGAMDLVWNPDWRIIGMYAYHCAAVTILLTMALLDRDDQHLSRSLVIFAVLVGVLPSTLWGSPFLFSLSSGVAAYFLYSVVHAVISVFVAITFKSLTGMRPEKVFNLAAALSVAGLFLGASIQLRAAYWGLFLVLFVFANSSRNRASRLNMTGLDSVWLALVALLAGGFLVQ